MTAATIGHRAQVTLLSDGLPGERMDGRRLAYAEPLEDPAAARGPLLEHASKRRKDRRAYDFARDVTGDQIAALSAAASAHKVNFGVAACRQCLPPSEVIRSAVTHPVSGGS
jgi:hypothetical protein